mmetsp:Transcript_2530/g.4061  ORF Transcript_2530/g.4061 Transcript_2530/m.4061 type:complete len:231 (+) Transcript_2530:545-1237(+)
MNVLFLESVSLILGSSQLLLPFSAGQQVLSLQFAQRLFQSFFILLLIPLGIPESTPESTSHSLKWPSFIDGCPQDFLHFLHQRRQCFFTTLMHYSSSAACRQGRQILWFRQDHITSLAQIPHFFLARSQSTAQDIIHGIAQYRTRPVRRHAFGARNAQLQSPAMIRIDGQHARRILTSRFVQRQTIIVLIDISQGCTGANGVRQGVLDIFINEFIVTSRTVVIRGRRRLL